VVWDGAVTLRDAQTASIGFHRLVANQIMAPSARLLADAFSIERMRLEEFRSGRRM